MGCRTDEDREWPSLALVDGRLAKIEFLSAELSRTLCVRGVIGDGFKVDTREEARAESNFNDGRPTTLPWYDISRVVFCSASSAARLTRDIGICWSDRRRDLGGGGDEDLW